MLVILYGILLGILTALFLCAPYTYYLLLISLFAASAIVFVISKKLFKASSKRHYIYALALFIVSYSVCTYIVFKPAQSGSITIDNNSSDKKAVIFYCEGEMEKYTPYYAKVFINDKPLLLKPLYAYKIKNIYRDLGVNPKNEQLTKIAEEVRSSILNYKPYYYYIAFSNYIPSISDSIYSAISDGCGEIIIINYTSKDIIENNLLPIINSEKLNNSGINIKITKSVADTDVFIDYMLSRIIYLPAKPDGILLISDENPSSKELKNKLITSGYTDNQVIISTDIQSSIKYFKDSSVKNLLYVNLKDTSSGIEGEVYIPGYFEKYCRDMRVSGIKDWGYDKKLVKACIEVFLKAANP